jgi:hypothetical protein
MAAILLLLQSEPVGPLKPHPPLDPYVRSALQYVDTPTVSVYIIAALIAFFLFGRIFSKRWADASGIVRAAFAISTFISGATVAAIFLFTEPVAAQNLSQDARYTLGIVTLVFTAQLGIQEVHTSFFKREPIPSQRAIGRPPTQPATMAAAMPSSPRPKKKNKGNQGS